MSDLSGRVAAITGASSGIGAATARALVGRGAKVVLGARRRDRLEALVAELGDAAAAVEMDVRDPEGSPRLIGSALDTFGGLDVLVANAGIGAYVPLAAVGLCHSRKLRGRGQNLEGVQFP